MTKTPKRNWYKEHIEPLLGRLGNWYQAHIEPLLGRLGNCYQAHIEPWLKGLWYLRIPAVVAILSVISFGCVPQTIEVYRVLALNAAEPKLSYADFQTLFSFVFILLLSFSIWYSANILIKYESGNKLCKQEQKEELKCLSNILSFVPIGSLIFGLANAINFLENFIEWILCIVVCLAVYCAYYKLIIECVFSQREPPKKDDVIFFAFIPFLMFWLFTFILIIPENPIKPILITVICLLTLVDILLFLFPGLRENNNKYITFLAVVVAVALVIISYYYLSKPELVTSVLGSISIISISFSGFVIFSSLISYVGYKYNFPILAILLISLTGFSWFDLNDNHRIRQVENPRSQQLMTLEKSFSDWKKARTDDIAKFREAKPKERYPIYIVSAQGGGIFAAYHAASTLSRLQDLCPEFASHVFAISGVSGGSLGAAAFSSLINTELGSVSLDSQKKLNCSGKLHKEVRGKLEQKAHELLNQDFLSPLLAAGLFPDSLQGFLPFPINSLDRARGLEYAFEKAWDSAYPPDSKEQKPNLLKGSYYDHWNPKKSAPALVLNTTVVETGDRLVLSPFKIDLPNLKDISSVACNAKKEDIIDPPLSTAAVLSARFISVTPVGWFNRCDRDEKGKPIQSSSRKSRLADGGYFENSGVSTAVEIGSRLEEFLRKEKEQEKIQVVYLAITDLRPQKIDRGFIELFGGLNEIMSPINALYNSRDARGFSIIDQAKYLTDPASYDPNSIFNSGFKKHYSSQRFRQFYLHNQEFTFKDGEKVISQDEKRLSENGSDKTEFPLGWLLSEPSQEAIKKLVGGSQDCGKDGMKTSNNDCVFESIKEELNY
ncbi:hypothetical protein NIES21_07060 [Anabaenopsis circularis NIES-21]|uniref:PNPLA domain-containing protein n=1 Tax=Anabaenopsis circularis NIES-21 TaxID=1085406 RepID=A0A1Z4GBM8_9CYAN|nr:hypothetical protein NIES21_07060 [Anabaenopsis circularis NIES-21]